MRSNFLRRAPLAQLLAVCAAIIVIGVAGTAFATALGSGPVPKPKPLASAIHDALTAPKVTGITASIKFTNNLIDAASLVNSDSSPVGDNPLLSGANGRLWLSADGRVRLELQASSGDAQLIYDGHTVTFYDASSNTLYRYTVPAGTSSRSGNTGSTGETGPPSVAKIQSELTKLMQHVTISGAIPGDIAGRPAYTVRISPSHDGGLVGAAQLAWDAVRGVPLRLAIYSTSSSTPVLELKATQISYGPVNSSVFDFATPPGAKIQDIQPASGGASTAGVRKAHRAPEAKVSGPAAVQAAVPFTLADPPSLIGLPRRAVKLLSFNGKPSALVLYGQGLGGVAVIEHQASPNAAAQPAPNPHSLTGSLPKVALNGASGTELATALGTLIQFERGGIAYDVVGSVPAQAAEAAARGL